MPSCDPTYTALPPRLWTSAISARFGVTWPALPPPVKRTFKAASSLGAAEGAAQQWDGDELLPFERQRFDAFDHV